MKITAIGSIRKSIDSLLAVAQSFRLNEKVRIDILSNDQVVAKQPYHGIVDLYGSRIRFIVNGDGGVTDHEELLTESVAKLIYEWLLGIYGAKYKFMTIRMCKDAGYSGRVFHWELLHET